MVIEESLLDFDEDYPIIFTQRCINIMTMNLVVNRQMRMQKGFKNKMFKVRISMFNTEHKLFYGIPYLRFLQYSY